MVKKEQNIQKDGNGRDGLSLAATFKGIEGYEILSKIGQGGMGTVYSARQIRMDREVALKVLLPKLAKDEEFVKRFLKEAHAAGKLNHPNIVSGIDAGESGGYYYFAMELVEGMTVARMLKSLGRIGERKALEIVLQVAKGLEYAGRHGLTHRDIKPGNIMVTHDGTAKLMDMGLARFADEDLSSAGGGVAGTPHYVSPEQARGDPILDARSDIYSLGATLYHMVTGSPPFDGSTAGAIMMKHVSEKLPAPMDRNPNLSPSTDMLIRKMMAKRPDDRFPTPSELVQNVGLILKGEEPRKPERSPGRMRIARLWKNVVRVGRIPRVKAAARIAAIAVLLGGVGYAAARWWVAAPTDISRRISIVRYTSGKTPSKSDPEQMYEYAQKWREEHPEDMDGAIGKFELVCRGARGTVWEMKALDAIDKLDTELKTAAMAEFDKLREKAVGLAADGDYDGAVAVFAEAAVQVRPIIKTWVAEETSLIETQAQTRITSVLETAGKIAAQGQPAEAIRSLDEISTVKFAALEPAVKDAKAELEKELHALAESRMKDGVAASREKLNRVWGDFDRRILAGDLHGARTVLSQVGTAVTPDAVGVAPESAGIAAALGELLSHFEKEREAGATFRKGLEKLVGTRMTVGTVQGPEDGVLRGIESDGLRLDQEIKRESVEATVSRKIPFAEMMREERNKWVAPPVVPVSPTAWVAGAVSALKVNDCGAARSALDKAGESPLVEHYREMAQSLHQETVEAAARKFWSERIAPFAAVETLTREQAPGARETLDRFIEEYGSSKYAESVEEGISKIRTAVETALLDPAVQEKETPAAAAYAAVWSKANPQTLLPVPARRWPGGFGSARDSKRKLCVLYTNNGLWTYDAAKNAWACLQKSDRIGGGRNAPKATETYLETGCATPMIYDAARDAYVINTEGGFWVYSPENQSWRREEKVRIRAVGMGYCPALKQVAACLWRGGSVAFDLESGTSRKITAKAPAWLGDPAADKGSLYAGGGLPGPSAAGEFLIFGGDASDPADAQTWLFAPSQNSWTRVDAATSPCPRLFPAVIYSPSLNAWVLFGGAEVKKRDRGELNDMWIYAPGSKGWVSVESGAGAAPAIRGAFWYEEALDSAVLFTATGETWTCKISPKEKGAVP